MSSIYILVPKSSYTKDNMIILLAFIKEEFCVVTMSFFSLKKGKVISWIRIKPFLIIYIYIYIYIYIGISFICLFPRPIKQKIFSLSFFSRLVWFTWDWIFSYPTRPMKGEDFISVQIWNFCNPNLFFDAFKLAINHN